MDVDVGRYDNITLDQYHNECIGWSKSALDKVHRSISHWLKEKDKPAEQTPALLFGSAFHCSILTPNQFNEEFCISPNFDKRTKAGKEDYAKFITENRNKQIIGETDYNAILGMQKSVFNHPFAGVLFNAGDAEHSFFWKDKATGLLCKCRPDYLRHDNTVVELKTCVDASYYAFRAAVAKYRYYVQGAFFCDGISAVLSEDINEFIIVAVEKTEPYAVAVYRLGPDELKCGRIEYESDLRKIQEYESKPINDRWPGYPDYIQDMFLPSYLYE